MTSVPQFLSRAGSKQLGPVLPSRSALLSCTSCPAVPRMQSRRASSVVAFSAAGPGGETPETPSTPYSPSQGPLEIKTTRRGTILSLACTAALVASTSPAVPAAKATKLGAGMDSAWEALGGGPSDLVFPDEFLGVWDVTSVLTRVETPLGEELVPNMAAVRRAQREDLDRATSYQVSFARNGAGKVVYDRAFNTASMLSMYYDKTMSFDRRINWDIDDPNVLTLAMPGMSVRTRVTRRLEEFPAPDRIETSEYVESVYQSGEVEGAPRIKASQCFTKYKFRSEQAAARDQGPAVVATQIVSDFLTAFDGEAAFIANMNRPYAQYTYRMAFKRPVAAA